METTTITVRVPVGLKQELNRLAQSTQRSKSWLAADALQQYLELNAWQITEIQKGIEEADKGDFASDKEVQSIFSKWEWSVPLKLP